MVFGRGIKTSSIFPPTNWKVGLIFTLKHVEVFPSIYYLRETRLCQVSRKAASCVLSVLMLDQTTVK